jgi:hypothetical protein|nr:MAG TPA: hypothetical protein [Caudoviricetes sp.]
MKVKDLIEACKDLDQDMEVIVRNDTDFDEADYSIVQVVAEQCGCFRYPRKDDKDIIKALKIW